MPQSQNGATKASSTASSKTITRTSPPTSVKTDATNPHYPWNAPSAAARSPAVSPLRLNPATASFAPPGTRPQDPDPPADRSATFSPVRPGLSSNISGWPHGPNRQQKAAKKVETESQRLWRKFLVDTTGMNGTVLPKISPWGPIAPPVKRTASPKSRLNPCSASFVPAPVILPPAPPQSSLIVNADVFDLPGSEILPAYVLNQFPPYDMRRQSHDYNHPQWSRMLSKVQGDNPSARDKIQQFAELEKQRYKGMI